MSIAPGPGDLIALLLDPDRRVAPAGFPRPGDEVGLPGLYAWYADQTAAVQRSKGLGASVEPGLIYAGQAGAKLSTATLGSRIGRNHLGGNVGSSTFRLTLASVLEPDLGTTKVTGRALAGDGEAALTRWMSEHLQVAVAPVAERSRLASLEAEVLLVLDPPLNLQGMAPTPWRETLSRLRSSLKREVDATPPRPRPERTAGSGAGGVRPGPGAPDMRVVLAGLVGQTIPTLTGRPNRILRIEGDVVIVGTGRSPQGKPVEIGDVQDAADRLYATGELLIDVESVGHRSAFVGAALAALPGTRTATAPRRIELVGRGAPAEEDRP